MSVRRLRSFASGLALVAGVGVASASCASTMSDAATITFRDGDRTRVVHIARADLQREVGEIMGNAQLRERIAQGGELGGDGENSADAGFTASWLTQLVQQAVVDAEFEARRLQVTEAARGKLREALERDLTPAVFRALSESFRERLVERQARQDAVFGSCPSGKLVSHILVETEAQAESVLAQLADPSRFGAVARAQSVDGSKEFGGALGCLAPDQFVPAFQRAAERAPLDTIVGPVETQFGFHVILVTRWDPRLAGQEPFKQGLRQAAQAALRARIAELRVRVDPRFGTWEARDDGQGGKQYGVAPPVEPQPRDQRERLPDE